RHPVEIVAPNGLSVEVLNVAASVPRYFDAVNKQLRDVRVAAGTRDLERGAAIAGAGIRVRTIADHKLCDGGRGGVVGQIDGGESARPRHYLGGTGRWRAGRRCRAVGWRRAADSRVRGWAPGPA